MVDRAEAVIRRVLDEPALLRVVFQPIVVLHSLEVVGYEALSRVEGIDPERLFKNAHALGLGVDVELLALRRILEARYNLEISPDCWVAVNATQTVMLDSRFEALLLGAHYPHRLVVELSEASAMAPAYRSLGPVARRLRHAGIRLAVDDVGIGHATLPRILELRSDIIKLDRSLVADLMHSEVHAAMVEALQAFAATMGRTLVVEGVETEEVRRLLLQMRCRFGQGYLFGKPAAEI